MNKLFSIIVTVALSMSFSAQSEASQRLHIIVTNDISRDLSVHTPELTALVDYSTSKMTGASTKVYMEAKEVPKAQAHKKIEFYLNKDDASLSISAIVVWVQWTRADGKLCEVRRDLPKPNKSPHAPYYSDIKVNLSDFYESKCAS